MGQVAAAARTKVLPFPPSCVISLLGVAGVRVLWALQWLPLTHPLSHAALHTGPVSSLLISTIGARRTVFLGVAMTMFGHFSSAFVNSYFVICITYGVIAGTYNQLALEFLHVYQWVILAKLIAPCCLLAAKKDNKKIL